MAIATMSTKPRALAVPAADPKHRGIQHRPVRSRRDLRLDLPRLRQDAQSSARVARRPKLRYAIIVIATVSGLALAQLGLSIFLADGAFTIADLQQQAKVLDRNNQAKQEQLSLDQSPQYLAEQAAAEGLTKPVSTTAISLSNGATISVPGVAIDSTYVAKHQNWAVDFTGNSVANSYLDVPTTVAATADQVTAVAASISSALSGITAMANSTVGGVAASEQTAAQVVLAENSLPAPNTR